MAVNMSNEDYTVQTKTIQYTYLALRPPPGGKPGMASSISV